MTVTLIYSACSANSQLSNMFSEFAKDSVDVLSVKSAEELSSAIKNSQSELTVVVGGLYSGDFSLSDFWHQNYDLPATFVATEKQNTFEKDRNILSVPQGFTPHKQFDGVVWGYNGEVDNKKILCICESDSPLLYTYMGGLHQHLVKNYSKDLPVTEPEVAEEIIPEVKIPEKPIKKPQPIAVPEPEPEPEPQPAVPEKRVKKRYGTRLVAFILVLSVLLVASIFVTGQYYVLEPNAYDSAVRRYQALYGSGEPAVLPDSYLPKFAALYLENEDIVGWLTVPDSNIDYPIVKGKNDRYAQRLLDGEQNRFGSLYTASNYRFGEFNYNTVIYGSNIDDERGFGALELYCDADYAQTHAEIFMDSVFSEDRWIVFAAVVFDPKQGFDPTKNYFFDSTSFDEFLQSIPTHSVLRTDVDVHADDQLLTLVTDYTQVDASLKFAVMARRVRQDETVPQIIAAQNTSAIYPDKYYIAQSQTVPTTQAATQAVVAPVQTTTPTETTTEPTTSTTTEPTTTTTTAPSTTETTTSTTTTTTTQPTTSTTTKTTVRKTKKTTTTTKKTTAKKTKKPTTTTSAATSTTAPTQTKLYKVRNQSTGEICEGTMTDLVAQIIEAEMGSSFHVEALKAQAVATYCWLLNNGIEKGSAPSVPMRTAGTRSKNAAKAVAGKTIRYNGKIINSTYFATSAGMTANSYQVWSGSLPYLVSVDSSVDRNASGFQTTRTYKASNVAKWVKNEYEVDLSKVADKSKWFQCTYDSNNLYCTEVSLGGLKSVKGTSLRNDLFTASRVGSTKVLRSHAYTIKYNASSDNFTFTVKGYGHGVGMSQTGANFYAANGWDYIQILKHYYTGVSVQ